MKNEIRLGDSFFDESNGRYLTVDGVGCDPNCFSCIQEEYDFDLEEDTVTGRVLMMRAELLKMQRMA